MNPSAFRGDGGAAARRWQRGVISVMAAVGMALLVGAASLGVDLGNLYYSKRQLQTIADTAALSAVNDIPAANAIAINAAGLNGFALPGPHANQLSTLPGSYNFLTRAFDPTAAAADWNAVQVTVTTNEPYFFMLGSRALSATATAVRNDIAGISIGTNLLNIDTQKSVLLNALLGKLLNTTLDLSVIAYQGLVGASLSLLDLVNADASIGTVDELLRLNLSVADLLNLTATALEKKNILGLDATVIDTVKLLALRTGGDLNLKLGDLIKLSMASGNDAAGAEINLLQLISLAAQVANGKNAISLPVVSVDLGGLAKLSVALTLIESPSIAIGPAGKDGSGNWRTEVHTAQTRLKLDLDLLQGLGYNAAGATAAVHVPLYVEIASGTAWVDRIQCRYPRDDSTVDVGVYSSALQVYLGEVNPDVMTNRNTLPTVSDADLVNVLGLIKITARAEVALPSYDGALAFNGPFNSGNTQSVHGLSTTGLYSKLVTDENNLHLSVELLGLEISLDPLVKVLLTLLTPVLALLDALLNPVLELLGIQLGIADVTVFSLKCGAPQLVR
ncbi:MAG: hypothetical protein H6R15_2148 [Proteobacteria bacterium]|nr:hypothetical protein [Pseudomonadota bacterium]